MRKGVSYPLRRWPRLSKGALSGACSLALLVAGSNAYVLLAAQGESTESRSPRCRRRRWRSCRGRWSSRTGEMSAMLADRVRQASALWHAGKVEKILVSGDHHTWAYDEPDTMRKALVADGVRPRGRLRGPRRLRHLGDDGAGARHLRRARRGCRHPGLPHAAGAVPRRRRRDRRDRAHRRPAPVGLSGATRARSARCSRGSRRSSTSPSTRRRWPARRSRSRSADGRESWGPPPPPGTPPAGSPGR